MVRQNASALKLYEKLGFTEVNRVENSLAKSGKKLEWVKMERKQKEIRQVLFEPCPRVPELWRPRSIILDHFMLSQCSRLV